MSYQVLARKWRPHSFADMVGQQHVLQALKNGLHEDRLHHAYLFTGTRGVGKTSLARIIAKCLNCAQGVSAEPCGQCSTCNDIDAGHFVDLIEVDAASKSKVEETRDLMDNVMYTPSVGRYKVYLIDEVHMFSNHSFNALLKTLEEPPPHVKFLLATTEPKKLPVTILSRCLQFNLKHLSIDQISAQLERILTAEKIPYDDACKTLIAQAADGSMRDALSLLDQAIAHGGGELLAAEVHAMLGTVEQTHIESLLFSIAAGDGDDLLQQVQHISEHNPNFDLVTTALLSLLQRIAVVQTITNNSPSAEVSQLAEQLSPEEVQLFYQIALLGRRDLSYAPDPRIGFEMMMIRMLAFATDTAQIPRKKKTPSVSAPKKTIDSGTNSQATKKTIDSVVASVSQSALNNATQLQDIGTQTWPQIIAIMQLSGIVGELAKQCAMIANNSSGIELRLSPSHENLLTEERKNKLALAIAEHFGEQVKLTLNVGKSATLTPHEEKQRDDGARQQAAVASIQADKNVQAMIQDLDATLDPSSIRPV